MSSMWNFGLTSVLPWWEWFLMVLGGATCVGAGLAIGGALVRAIGSTFQK